MNLAGIYNGVYGTEGIKDFFWPTDGHILMHREQLQMLDRLPHQHVQAHDYPRQIPRSFIAEDLHTQY